MLQPVALANKSLSDYRHIVDRNLIEEIHTLAAPLKGKRVIHLSATAFGGGVSEILYTLIPLMRDVGLETNWEVIYGREEFYNATKLMHNALQGGANDLSEEQWELWHHFNEINAEQLSDGWDFAIVHDPQPAAIYKLASEKAKTWLWRCHIDLSTPNERTINRLLPFLIDYHDALFHVAEYVPKELESIARITPPAIDPLSPKNMGLSIDDARYICEQFGIDTQRPLVCQVSRFDPWKDPNGVIDSYRITKQNHPSVQLALLGSMASDDPEGWDFFNSTIEHAADDCDIHILNNFNNVGAIEVNAFQTLSDVMVQKSTREGFGLTVSEALWKARPFIGGNVGGIPLQIENGVSGYLVDTVELCAQRTAELLDNPAKAGELGRKGKAYVRENFLMPRYLRDYLKYFNEAL